MKVNEMSSGNSWVVAGHMTYDLVEVLCALIQRSALAAIVAGPGSVPGLCGWSQTVIV